MPSGEDQPKGQELDDLRSPVEQYAAQHSLTFAEATNELQSITRLTQYADSMRGAVGYAGFKVERTTDGVEGVLAMVETAGVSLPTDLSIRVVSAKVAEADHKTFGRDLVDDLVSEVPNVAAVTYDPFSDQVTVWRDEGVEPASQRVLLANRVRASLGSDFATTSIVFDNVVSASLARGGERLQEDDGGLCTTGFGVSKWIGGWKYGYTTAGHCEALNGPGWDVLHSGNTYPVQNYYDQRIGWYWDREFYEAGGASWLTRVASSTYQDMSSSPTHLYQGAFYCHYGSRSNDQDCDTLVGVNLVFTQGPWTFYLFVPGPAATCTTGDSGGPVWQPNFPQISIPAGIIEAGTTWPAETDCWYLALDDQLGGTGWNMLWNTDSVPTWFVVF